MVPSTIPHISRIRDAVLNSALREYIQKHDPTPDPSLALRTHRATKAYEKAATIFLQESDEDRVLSDVRRADFDGELIARLDAALDSSMHWAFNDEQRDRCRLLMEVVTGSTNHWTLFWNHELERFDMADARIQEMAGTNADIDKDALRRRIGFIIRRDDDDDGEKEDGGDDDDEEEEDNQVDLNEAADDKKTTHDYEVVDDHNGDVGHLDYDNNVLEDDDCIMYGKYIGGDDEGVGKRWVCLICVNHAGTAHKGSFVRHLANKHGIRDVRKALRYLPTKG
ncbi:hypothetical protein RBB50_000987 [Rhinocladiella similis]